MSYVLNSYLLTYFLAMYASVNISNMIVFNTTKELHASAQLSAFASLLL